MRGVATPTRFAAATRLVRTLTPSRSSLQLITVDDRELQGRARRSARGGAGTNGGELSPASQPPWTLFFVELS